MKRIREFLDLAMRFRNTPIVSKDFEKLRDDFDDEMQLLRIQFNPPEVVCLCGSTRFKSAYEEMAKLLTLEGCIVLAVGLFGHVEGNMDGEIKKKLDELHKRKIDISDWVHVLNVGGYIGESTRNEIEYAKQMGIPVKYLEPVAPPVISETVSWAALAGNLKIGQRYQFNIGDSSDAECNAAIHAALISVDTDKGYCEVLLIRGRGEGSIGAVKMNLPFNIISSIEEVI